MRTRAARSLIWSGLLIALAPACSSEAAEDVAATEAALANLTSCSAGSSTGSSERTIAPGYTKAEARADAKADAKTRAAASCAATCRGTCTTSDAGCERRTNDLGASVIHCEACGSCVERPTNPPASSCERKEPYFVTRAPYTKSGLYGRNGNPGETKTFTFDITNNDSDGCGPTEFTVGLNARILETALGGPAALGENAAFAAVGETVTIRPGETGTAGLRVTPRACDPIGRYLLQAKVNELTPRIGSPASALATYLFNYDVVNEAGQGVNGLVSYPLPCPVPASSTNVTFTSPQADAAVYGDFDVAALGVNMPAGSKITLYEGYNGGRVAGSCTVGDANCVGGPGGVCNCVGRVTGVNAWPRGQRVELTAILATGGNGVRTSINVTKR